MSVLIYTQGQGNKPAPLVAPVTAKYPAALTGVRHG